MLSIGNVLLGALPGVLWMAWVRRKDDHEPEPWQVVYAVFLLGCGAALAQGYLRPRLEVFALSGSPLRDHLVDSFLVTALSEEILKFAAFAAGALWLAEWDEPLDGIIYGAAAGLGFASIENAYFVAATGEPSLVLARAFTSTLGHVAFSGGLGFAIGLARVSCSRHRRARIRLAIAGALAVVLSHGAYDALLLAPGMHVAALLGVLPLLLVAFALAFRWARSRSPLWHR